MDFSFSESKILIVGDIMIDRYYTGDVSRISPEAPVPVVKIDTVVDTLGGACNVANNIFGLGASSSIIGLIGDDSNGKKVKKMLAEIKSTAITTDAGTRTTAKLRVIGSRQQIVRLDFEDEIKMSDKVTKNIKSDISKEINRSNFVVISDYGKGVCSVEICRYLIDEANKLAIPIIVDPKGSNWDKYKSATIVTPNVKELSEVAGVTIKNNDDDIVRYGQEIRKKYKLKYLIVTRSEKGISIISGRSVKHFPAEAREVFDVSGAGDTVVATLAVSLSSGYSLDDSVAIANRAAGIVVGKAQTVPIKIDELTDSYTHKIKNNKVVPLGKLLKIIADERAKGKKIVFTNGCFDILHRGHVSYLEKAKEIGDILVLGLNSDKSVKKLKGKDRPINDEHSRGVVLSALSSIDYIIVFNDDTPLNLIKAIRPDVLTKGSDYKVDEVVGREFAGKVQLIDFIDGFSTTKTIKKMKGDM